MMFSLNKQRRVAAFAGLVAIMILAHENNGENVSVIGQFRAMKLLTGRGNGAEEQGQGEIDLGTHQTDENDENHQRNQHDGAVQQRDGSGRQRHPMPENAFFILHFIGADQYIAVLRRELSVAINDALSRCSDAIDQIAYGYEQKRWGHGNLNGHAQINGRMIHRTPLAFNANVAAPRGRCFH